MRGRGRDRSSFQAGRSRAITAGQASDSGGMGPAGSPGYRLQVSSAEGGTCYVTVHLSFLGDDPRNHGGAPAEDVDQQLRRSSTG